MRRYLIALTVGVFAMTTGISTALAGGSSDSSGDGFHCYLFFEDVDGWFAQAMMNGDDSQEVLDSRNDFLVKYIDDEGLVLTAQIGNISGKGFPVCKQVNDPKCSCLGTGKRVPDPPKEEDPMKEVPR